MVRMSDVKVTFVTVCYKTPDLIRNLLKGVEAANFSFPFEYYLVDNNPGDGTGEMVRQRFPWVKVIDSPGNIGFGAGNNQAFRLAKGEYVMLFNPDLTVFAGEMEKLLAFADANARIGIVGPRLQNPNQTLQRTYYRAHRFVTPIYRRTFLGKTPWGKRELNRFLMVDTDERAVQDVDGLIGAALLMRSSMLAEVGHFDEKFFMYFEDVDLCRRAWEKGWRVCYAPVAQFVHYHQRESRIKWPWEVLTNRTSRAHIASALHYFRKYRGKALPRPS